MGASFSTHTTGDPTSGDAHTERSADPVEDLALHDHPESGAALRDDVEAVLRDHSGAALRDDLVRQDSCDEALADDLEPWLFCGTT